MPVNPGNLIAFDDFEEINNKIKDEILLKGYVENTPDFRTRLEEQIATFVDLEKKYSNNQLILVFAADFSLLRLLDTNGPVIIPYDQRKDCFLTVHTSPRTFHQGAPRTYDICKEYFYFLDMKS